MRAQLALESTQSGPDGAFTLTGLSSSAPVTVTAWAAGYYNGIATGIPGGDPITIELKPYYATDNPNYNWFAFEGVNGSASCGLCHTAYSEWQADAHAQSATDPRFLSVYAGTDVHGNRSPEPIKNNLGIPQPPDLSQPYYGPGHALDYPNRPGNCAACHTPVASQIANKQNCAWSGCHASSVTEASYGILDPGVFPLDLKGHAAEGITCEFCHKIGDVILNRETQRPYEDMPGILSMKLYRPREGNDIFFGSLDDVYRTDLPVSHDSYLPLMEESAFCAGCHYGVMGGVVGNMQVTGGVLVYNSYGEWLDSPYSDPETGKTCQDCHMPAASDYAPQQTHFVYPERGGHARDPQQIHNHQMGGASDEWMLQHSVSLTTTTKLMPGRVVVNVNITNDQVGHHIPTDSPLRHMILVVEAKDADGNLLAARYGSVLPEWTGNYAGQRGKVFAKVLQDEWTQEMPTAAYWRPVRLVSDTRIPALATDRSVFAFTLPETDTADVTVEARLIFRRAYQQLQEWKGWTDPDILMVAETIELSVSQP